MTTHPDDCDNLSDEAWQRILRDTWDAPVPRQIIRVVCAPKSDDDSASQIDRIFEKAAERAKARIAEPPPPPPPRRTTFTPVRLERWIDAPPPVIEKATPPTTKRKQKANVEPKPKIIREPKPKLAREQKPPKSLKASTRRPRRSSAEMAHVREAAKQRRGAAREAKEAIAREKAERRAAERSAYIARLTDWLIRSERGDCRLSIAADWNVPSETVRASIAHWRNGAWKKVRDFINPAHFPNCFNNTCVSPFEAKAAKTRQAILQAFARGEKPIDVARSIGVTPNHVRQIWRDARLADGSEDRDP